MFKKKKLYIITYHIASDLKYYMIVAAKDELKALQAFNREYNVNRGYRVVDINPYKFCEEEED